MRVAQINGGVFGSTGKMHIITFPKNEEIKNQITNIGDLYELYS